MALPNIEKTYNMLGNCLVPGSYGLGGQCENITGDLNTACGNQTGFYMGNGLENKPEGSSPWIYVIHLVHNELFKKQIAFHFSANNIWVRTMINGTWSDWQAII